MMKAWIPERLTKDECVFIVGLLDDIQWDKEYYTAWDASDRRLIESIIDKLGGTVVREVHRNV